MQRMRHRLAKQPTKPVRTTPWSAAELRRRNQDHRRRMSLPVVECILTHLVPPPRTHLTRVHGVLASRSMRRAARRSAAARSALRSLDLGRTQKSLVSGTANPRKPRSASLHTAAPTARATEETMRAVGATIMLALLK